MNSNENKTLEGRIHHIRRLSGNDTSDTDNFEAAALAQTVLYDTVGGSHPLMAVLRSALEKPDWSRAIAGCRGVVKLFEEDGLTSPRLVIAHEIEGDILDIARDNSG